MRKKAIAAIVALLALSVTTVLVWGSAIPITGSSEVEQDGDARIVAQEESKPFIGVVVSTLHPARAQELGIAGGAVVRRVRADGP